MAPGPAISPYRLLPLAQKIFVAMVLLFLVGPLLIIVPLSFSSSSLLIYPLPGVSMRWYENLLTNPQWLVALQHSFVIAAATTVLATGLGTLAALGLASPRLRLRPLILSIVLSPMIVPAVVTAVGMFFYYARLGLTASFTGIIIAHTAIALPFVIITVTSTLQSFDRTLSRAAASLGASPLMSFRTVTLPIIMPGVASGAVFAFSTSFDEIVIILFLASPDQRTLPRQLFDNIQYNIDPTVAAAATVMVIMSAVLLTAVEMLRQRSQRASQRLLVS